ncbi:MAG: hypothetical protein RSF82_07445, partial [Angelakisella sp.]
HLQNMNTLFHSLGQSLSLCNIHFQLHGSIPPSKWMDYKAIIAYKKQYITIAQFFVSVKLKKV